MANSIYVPIQKAATDIGAVHIGRADDAIAIYSTSNCLEAGWVTGDKTLKLYRVVKNLTLTTTTIN